MISEWRKPFGLVTDKKRTPKDQQYTVRYAIRESIYSKPISVSKHTFKRIDSDLLIAIDNDDVGTVQTDLEKDKINVDNLYVIPDWEVPEAGKPMFQTFLHRALWEKSEKVFKFLLEKGANPRIEGHCHETVIESLFDDRYSGEYFLKFGHMLVDAGMTVQEIKKNSEYKDDKAAVSKLIRYARAKEKPRLISKQKRPVYTSTGARIKD